MVMTLNKPPIPPMGVFVNYEDRCAWVREHFPAHKTFVVDHTPFKTHLFHFIDRYTEFKGNHYAVVGMVNKAQAEQMVFFLTDPVSYREQGLAVIEVTRRIIPMYEFMECVNKGELRLNVQPSFEDTQ